MTDVKLNFVLTQLDFAKPGLEPHNLSNVAPPWLQVNAVAATEKAMGSGIFYFQTPAAGTFVVKGGRDMALELFCFKLYRELHIETPPLSLLPFTDKQKFKDAQHHIARLTFQHSAHADLFIKHFNMPFLMLGVHAPGLQIQELGPRRAQDVFNASYPQSRDRMIRLGMLVAMDLFVNQETRFPLLNSLEQMDSDDLLCLIQSDGNLTDRQLRDPDFKMVCYLQFAAMHTRGVFQSGDATRYCNLLHDFCRDIFYKLKLIRLAHIDPFSGVGMATLVNCHSHYNTNLNNQEEDQDQHQNSTSFENYSFLKANSDQQFQNEQQYQKDNKYQEQEDPLKGLVDYIHQKTGFRLKPMAEVQIMLGIVLGMLNINEFGMGNLQKLMHHMQHTCVEEDWHGVWQTSCSKINLDFLQDTINIFKKYLLLNDETVSWTTFITLQQYNLQFLNNQPLIFESEQVTKKSQQDRTLDEQLGIDQNSILKDPLDLNLDNEDLELSQGYYDDYDADAELDRKVQRIFKIDADVLSKSKANFNSSPKTSPKNESKVNRSFSNDSSIIQKKNNDNSIIQKKKNKQDNIDKEKVQGKQKQEQKQKNKNAS